MPCIKYYRSWALFRNNALLYTILDACHIVIVSLFCSAALLPKGMTCLPRSRVIFALNALHSTMKIWGYTGVQFKNHVTKMRIWDILNNNGKTRLAFYQSGKEGYSRKKEKAGSILDRLSLWKHRCPLLKLLLTQVHCSNDRNSVLTIKPYILLHLGISKTREQYIALCCPSPEKAMTRRIWTDMLKKELLQFYFSKRRYQPACRVQGWPNGVKSHSKFFLVLGRSTIISY